MRTGQTQDASRPELHVPVDAMELFRALFQSSLRQCVKRRFSVAESFGVIWIETLEQVALPEEDQASLYEELINWAKQADFNDVIHSHSPDLLT